MKSIFETLGGTYKQVGDYLLPDVEVTENPEVGFWGMQRRKYLLEHQSTLYSALFLGGKLFNLCCSLCTAYEHKDFVTGLQYGAHLMAELNG